jgi:hypothetical protein
MTAAECRGNATQCYRRAREADDIEDKAAFQETAEGWQRMAERAATRDGEHEPLRMTG